ncbi:MAG: C40 family peptidase [Flaviflexus sp.]|uniref:C40 family peptidase n=1 Tax=Flaviflexus sp. TaxID=1969482 RepID=UPI003F90EE3A
MIKSQRTGRHAAAAPIKPMTAGVVTAGAATAGLMFSAAVPSAVGSEEQIDASERITLDEKPTDVAPEAFTVQVDDVEDFDLDAVTVTAEAAPEPEPEPVVEEVVEAPVAETTTATEAAPAQTQAATTQTATQAATTQTTTQAATTQTTTQAAEPEPVVEAAPVQTYSATGSRVVAIARSYAGAPYVWGGTSPAGWDCIGFADYVYNQVGVDLPNSSSGARYAGYQVSASQAQPGDLMWWPGHVGIYTGNGMHIAAWNPSMGTQEAPVWGSPIYLRVLG